MADIGSQIVINYHLKTYNTHESVIAEESSKPSKSGASFDSFPEARIVRLFELLRLAGVPISNREDVKATPSLIYMLRTFKLIGGRMP